jgi:hypothetical protein
MDCMDYYYGLLYPIIIYCMSYYGFYGILRTLYAFSCSYILFEMNVIYIY